MTTYWVLIRRELGAYAVSPILYVLLTAFLFISGIIFSLSMLSFDRKMVPTFLYTFDTMSYITVIFFAPLITMRLMAEEKSRGTIETLMTAPVTDTQVVLSKFISTVIVYFFMLLTTLLFVVLMNRYASVDPGEICGGYIALLLLAGAMFSIGLFISSLCVNQVSAAVVSIGIATFMTLSNTIAAYVPTSMEEGFWRTVGDAVESALAYIHFPGKISNMARGIMESRDIVFFLTVTALFLFLTIRVANSRRWK